MSGSGSVFDRSIVDRAKALRNAVYYARVATDLGNEVPENQGIEAPLQAYATLSLAWSAIAAAGDSVIWKEYYSQLEDAKNLAANQAQLAGDGRRVFGAGWNA